MKMPVFFNQKKIGFSLPWSQPTSHAKKLPAFTELWIVDQSNCGTAITEATAKNVNHSRHRRWINARQPAIAITTTNLGTCPSGNTPAATPAAIMRRILSEKRAFGSSCQTLFCRSLTFDFFLLEIGRAHV